LGSLHFFDATHERWTTLRSLSLAHEPQVFTARFVRVSRMAELLWSEAHAEWVHPGESEALKAFRDAEAERERSERALRKAQAERERLEREVRFAANHGARPTAREPRRLPATAENHQPFSKRPLDDLVPNANDELEDGGAFPKNSRDRMRRRAADRTSAASEIEALPWLTAGLICVGCAQRTTDWQNASPGQDVCVCRVCFTKGVRLNR
jgi:hypothetical protein